jgi:hypothetical protein
LKGIAAANPLFDTSFEINKKAAFSGGFLLPEK